VGNQVQVIRGMHDVLPSDMPVWNQLEDNYRALVESYGYRQIRTPIVEKTALFKRSVGEATDIVEKEMYTFDDRNGDSLSLRPENTASVVRAVLESGIVNDQLLRLWYYGPMFRHERPQKGRYRQFQQFGAETFGMAGADVEAELILMASRFWKQLGLDSISLQINTLGSNECRIKFREVLVSYLCDHRKSLDEDSLRRLETNPLRVLDSKNPDMQSMINNAPKLQDSLNQESSEHFSQLRDILDHSGVTYDVNPRLVRGLDYYCHTVFEWVTDTLGSQGTVCAGGRYDGLVEQLGGKPNHAAGFAMGCERLISMLIDQGKADTQHHCDIYLSMRGDDTARIGQKLAEDLRDRHPNLGLIVHAGGGSFKSQMKKADKSGAKVALILGESEIESGSIAVKFLREDRPQVEIMRAELADKLSEIL
jgi:histidyl-tRNA synthetase